jgi:hypothetical protein
MRTKFGAMRARLIVRAPCVQVLLAIAVNQVGTICLSSPVADHLIGQFTLAPQALIVLGSGTQKLEATTRRLAGTDAMLAADPICFAKGTKGRFRTAIDACLARVAIVCGNIDRQALCGPSTVNPTNVARPDTSTAAGQPVSAVSLLA